MFMPSMDGSENLSGWGVNLDESALSKSVAVVSCIAMTFFYVAILYTPTLIFRLPPPSSINTFLIRRFICAAVSSVASLFVCALILRIKWWDVASFFSVYGIRSDHIWQALVFPLSLTSLMYAGSIVLKPLMLLYSWKDNSNRGGEPSFFSIKTAFKTFINWIMSIACDISAWRTYFVGPLTEELVFRACMIPLLLCGGFKTYTVIFMCPVFFSLAHLNHLLEFYAQYNGSLLRASMAVGFQLGYTAIFGSYASFLFVRTGHLSAPLIAHMFCNFMGLPAMFSRRTGIVGVAFIAGMVGFFLLLFPLTNPYLYNEKTDSCKCWQRYCSWS